MTKSKGERFANRVTFGGLLALAILFLWWGISSRGFIPNEYSNIGWTIVLIAILIILFFNKILWAFHMGKMIEIFKNDKKEFEKQMKLDERSKSNRRFSLGFILFLLIVTFVVEQWIFFFILLAIFIIGTLKYFKDFRKN